ncbi:MAG: hypothetical protein WCI93_00695, partial [bacterium]
WQPATDHIYYSLPTETGTITATVLDGTTFTTGGGIQQVAKSSLGKVDGNGWLPIDFSSLSGGSPISALPIDPVNTISSLSAPTNTDLVYRYICSEKDQSFEIDATLESIAYTSTDNKMSKDGGNNDSYYEVGTGLKLFSGDLILNVGVPYQGGIIGYIYQVGDPGYVAGATHGLIAATSDQGSSIVWGCDGSNLTGANGTALGTGYQNTNDIISGCATLGIAARVARAYNGGGYSDWSLPSLDELDKFSLNRASIGNFGPYPYLASSETGDGLYSWYVHFGFGTVFNALASKNNPVFYVRAVRSF